MMQGNLPFDQNGVIPLPKLPVKPVIQKFYDKRGLDENIILDKCQDLFL
jgi:hypothetical protein